MSSCPAEWLSWSVHRQLRNAEKFPAELNSLKSKDDRRHEGDVAVALPLACETGEHILISPPLIAMPFTRWNLVCHVNPPDLHLLPSTISTSFIRWGAAPIKGLCDRQFAIAVSFSAVPSCRRPWKLI